MANPEANWASSTLLSFNEPSIRHSGLQYHPRDTTSEEYRPQPQTHAFDGGEPVRFYQSQGYPIEAGPHELPPQNQQLDSQARSPQGETDGVHVENLGKEKHRCSSAAFGASPLKLANIVVIWTIILVAVAVGGGVGGAVVSKCSKRVQADKGDAAKDSSEANSTRRYGFNDYKPAPQVAVNTTKLECPAIDASTYSTRAGPASFTLVCDRFYQNSERIWTIGRINVYTPEECWEGCANMNQWTKQNLGWDDPPCDFASFSTRMVDMWESGQGNCMFINKNNGKKMDGTWEKHSGTGCFCSASAVTSVESSCSGLFRSPGSKLGPSHVDNSYINRQGVSCFEVCDVDHGFAPKRAICNLLEVARRAVPSVEVD